MLKVIHLCQKSSLTIFWQGLCFSQTLLDWYHLINYTEYCYMSCIFKLLFFSLTLFAANSSKFVANIKSIFNDAIFIIIMQGFAGQLMRACSEEATNHYLAKCGHSRQLNTPNSKLCMQYVGCYQGCDLLHRVRVVYSFSKILIFENILHMYFQLL